MEALMSAEIIFASIIGILVFDFILERFLSFLNYKTLSDPVPEELAEIYDSEQYAKQQQYERENLRFSNASSVFSFILVLLMLVFGGFAYADGIARGFSGNPVIAALIFFAVILVSFDLVSSPFEIYDTFVIEQKYGFNTVTPLLYVADKLKGWLLGGIIGGLILSLVILFITHFPENFWLYAWATVTFFMVFFTMFFSSLIVPLFNKQVPLEDGELKSEIENFAANVGFKIDNIFVMDGSKRTKKANAYFSGLFGKKRIVLYDTLISELSPKEITAVLAHEVGHYKKKHTLMMIFASVIQMGVLLFILNCFISNDILSKALGAKEHSIHMAIITFGILYVPVSTLIGVLQNIFSRRNEYEADNFAAENYSAEHLVSGLKKLSRNNLSNLTPHPLYVFFHYSHPPLLERVKNLMRLSSGKSSV